MARCRYCRASHEFAQHKERLAHQAIGVRLRLGIGIACHQQECLFRGFASSFVFYPHKVHAPETIQDEHLFRQAGVRVDQLARPGEGVWVSGAAYPLIARVAGPRPR